MEIQMETAKTALQAAGDRQERLDKLNAEHLKELADIVAAQKLRGSGRPKQAICNRKGALNKKIARLDNGLLPDESAEVPTVMSKEQLAAGARDNAQHHGAPSQMASPGRPAKVPRVGTASGGGGGDDGDGGGDDDDDDEEEEDPGFQQYYTVSSGQKAFNEQATRGYLKHGGESPCIHPPSLLRGCCKSELIGLGPCHVHAPHIERDYSHI